MDKKNSTGPLRSGQGFTYQSILAKDGAGRLPREIFDSFGPDRLGMDVAFGTETVHSANRPLVRLHRIDHMFGKGKRRCKSRRDGIEHMSRTGARLDDEVIQKIGGARID